MGYPKYQIDNHFEIPFSLASQKDELIRIAKKVFDVWSIRKPEVSDHGLQNSVTAFVKEISEGMSGTDVFQLEFRVGKAEVVARFILRVHHGDDANAEARREREIAIQLSDGTHSDAFSAQVEEPIPGCENLVVYRHSDDQFGSQSQSLQEAIIDLLENRTNDAHTMAQALRRTMRAVVAAYGQFQPPMLCDSEQFLEKLRPRLAPDILVDASTREVELTGNVLVILSSNVTKPNSKTPVKTCDLASLRGMLAGIEDSRQVWLAIPLSFDRAFGESNTVLRFRTGDGTIWIRVKAESNPGIHLKPSDQVTLQLLLDDVLALTNEKALEAANYSPTSVVQAGSLLEFCRAERTLLMGMRHSDLHCKNIRWGGNSAKVIDLGSRDLELLAISEARLEVSIWNSVTRRFSFDDADIRLVLKNLQMDKDPNPATMSSQSYALNLLLSGIRRGAGDGHKNQPTPRQITLAYVVQTLLYQRYQLEQNQKATIGLDIVTTHWLERLHHYANDVPDESLPEVGSSPQVLRSLPDVASNPTLLSLWIEALSAKEIGFFDARAEKFLEVLASSNDSVLASPLTDFQLNVWKAAQNPGNLFKNSNHVILAAPTSSGKSTVAEMFLLRPYLTNSRRTCALYIAPTRALTQAKFRELKERFRGDSDLSDGILLSTGENTEHDWRINHGQFAIACLVYEKANILFSQNVKLLERLGCVVIDEFHMLSDLHRGPMLEVALTKVMLQRQRIDESSNRAPNKETVRIVAISTEGGPDGSVQNFLTSHDFSATAPSPERQPTVVLSNERPVTVRHWLVLPRIAANEAYHKSAVGEFTPQRQRTLGPGQRKELDRRLHGEFLRTKHLSDNGLGVRQEIEKRVVHLVKDILVQFPRGHQILVFVPSRAQIEDSLSGALRNSFTQLWSADGSLKARKQQFQRDIVDRIQLPLEAAEDKRMAKLVLSSAELGILVHHSDIDKRVRTEVEQICATMPDASYSRIILATETLSYGVNLALHDVVLLGTEFYTSTRFGDSRLELLSQCAFHNMVGRAGRLGKPGAETANVYIVVPQDTEPKSVIADYYSSIDKADSQLFVNEDRAKQSEQKQGAEWHTVVQPEPEESSDPSCDKYRNLEAKHLSYPFVRSILDSLRHLNAVQAQGYDRASVTSDDLLIFLGSTLYVEQFVKENPAERSLFRCAVLRVLESCGNKPLELVSHDGGNSRSYVITPRGEAVIDTGTEIQTVAPLLGIVDDSQTLWEKHFGEAAFPVELLILCALAQNEVLRDFIRYTPEGRTRNPWPKQQIQLNHEDVLTKLVAALSHIVPTSKEGAIRSFAMELSKLVMDCVVSPANVAYRGGEADSVIRFFNGIESWIRGEDREIAYQLIEGDGLPERYRGKMERLGQFTELLKNKIVFLAKILANGRSGVAWLQPERERELRLLALRVRLGCMIEAIPLFWPWSSNFSRREAIGLMRSGITPAVLLLSPTLPKQSTLGLSSERLSVLREDLEEYVLEDLDELHTEIIAGHQGQTEAHRESINRLWNVTRSSFETGIKQFRTDDLPQISFDSSLRNAFSVESPPADEDPRFGLTVRKPQFDEDFRIRASAGAEHGGLVWFGEKLEGARNDDDGGERHWKSDTFINVLGVQFRAGWDCTIDGKSWVPFSSLLALNKKKKHLVIVALPWLPSGDEMPNEVTAALKQRHDFVEFSTTIVTPAAFATMATFIMRDFVSSEECVAMLTRRPPNGQLFNVIATVRILQLADGLPERQVPSIIREKMIELFEVLGQAATANLP